MSIYCTSHTPVRRPLLNLCDNHKKIKANSLYDETLNFTQPITLKKFSFSCQEQVYYSKFVVNIPDKALGCRFPLES